MHLSFSQNEIQMKWKYGAVEVPADLAESNQGRKEQGFAQASTSNSNPIPNKREMDMSSKPKRIGSAEGQSTFTQVETGEVSVGNVASDEDIRRRAYEIYLERGEQPGRELDDWLQAERELEGGVLAQAG
jgi:Protein of unknown function (DUF2934)